jgi:hypothetical protein
MVIASFVVAIFALLVAGASAGYTRKQAREQAKVTEIEQDRRHEELTPQFQVACEGQDGEGTHATLTLELTGPTALAELEEVIVRIRDDMPDRKPGHGSQVTQGQIAEVIWGPYRIMPGLHSTPANGREHGAFRLPKNEPYPIPLERSMAPSWMVSPATWREQYDGKPVRIEITGQRNGDKPWVVPVEVRVEYPPQAFVV